LSKFLYTQDHSHVKPMCDCLLDPNPNNPPSNKESPCKLNFLHNETPNARLRSNSSLREANTPYVTNCSGSLLYTANNHSGSLLYTVCTNYSGSLLYTAREAACPFPKYLASQIALQGPTIARLLAPNWGINNIEHHPHTRLS